MTATVGTSTNTNNEAEVLDAIAVSSVTSTILLAAQAVTDQPRIKVIVHNDGVLRVWIKFQPAAADNDIKGLAIAANSFETVLAGSDIYTGEISAIAEAGTQDIYVTWF